VFDVITENYPFHYNTSRLGLEVMIIHGGNVKNGSIHLNRTSDDEYTPSVFSTYTYHVSGKNKDSNDMGGYAQWKPISYQDKNRKSTSSQQVTIVPTAQVSTCSVQDLPEGLAEALFGNESSVSNMTRWFVVFETSGDDTYIINPVTQTNISYNTW